MRSNGSAQPRQLTASTLRRTRAQIKPSNGRMQPRVSRSALAPKLGPGAKPRSEVFAPNKVPRAERWFNALLAVFLLCYGAIGFYSNSMSVGGRGRTWVLLREGPAWLMSAAMVVGALVLVSVVVDHYDRRNNETIYQAFKWVAVRIGWSLAAASLLSHLYLTFVR